MASVLLFALRVGVFGHKTVCFFVEGMKDPVPALTFLGGKETEH